MHFWLQVAWYALEIKDVRKTLETLETNLDMIWPYCLLSILEAGAVQIIRRSRRTRKEIARQRWSAGEVREREDSLEDESQFRSVIAAADSTSLLQRRPTLLFLRNVYLAWIKYIVMSSRRRSIVLRRDHYWLPLLRGTSHQKYACLRSGYLSTRSFSHRDILGDVPELSDGRG